MTKTTDEQQEQRLTRIEKAVERLAGLATRGRTFLRVDRQRVADEDDPNFIAHGSEAHAVLLGLIEVGEEDKAEAKELDYICMADKRTGKTWRLADEEDSLRHYPSLDLDVAVKRTLMSKLNVFTAGRPEVPEGTQEMWSPGGGDAILGLGLPRDGSVEVIQDGDETTTIFTPWQSIGV